MQDNQNLNKSLSKMSIDVLTPEVYSSQVSYHKQHSPGKSSVMSSRDFQFRPQGESFSTHIQEVSQLKKDNLHMQYKNQELVNLKTILENQIAQKNASFMEKETLFNNEISRYIEENESLKQKNKSLEYDLRNQGIQFSTLKKTNEREMDSLKHTHEEAYENFKNREIRELTLKFNQERNEHNIETNRVQESLSISNLENNQLLKFLHDQEAQCKELKQFEKKYIESESHNNSLKREIERNREEMEKKSSQIEQFKAVKKFIKQKHDMDILLNKNQKQFQENTKNQNLVIQDHENKILSLQYEIDYFKSFQQKSNDQEQQIDNLVQQVQKLNLVLKDRNHELDIYKTKNEQQEDSLIRNEKQIEDLNHKIKLITQSNDENHNQLTKLKEEHSILRQKYTQLDHENINLKIIEQKNKENELKIQALNQELNDAKLQIRDFEITLGSKSNLIDQLENQLNNLNQKNQMYSQELERCKLIIKNKNSEIDEITQQLQHYRPFEEKSNQQNIQIDQLVKEINRLNGQCISYMNEIEHLSYKNSDLNKYYTKYQEKDDESSQLKEEIQVLLNKQSEMTKLQFAFNDQQTEIRLLKKEIDRAQQSIHSKQKEIDHAQKRYQQIDLTCHSLKEENTSNQILNQEINRLKTIIKEKDSDINEWRSSYLQQASMAPKNQDQQGTILQYEVETMKQLLSEKDKDIDHLNRYLRESYSNGKR